MPLSRFCSALAGALAALFLSAAAAQELERDAFVDRFAAIDRSRWIVSDGWSIGDWVANDWRASHVRRAEHGLSILLARQSWGDKPFSSGELQTHRRFRYGYFEARLRAPRGSGMVTGFFTYARPQGRRSWNEIDVEILGRDTRRVLFSYYSGGEQHSVERDLGFDAADGWHSYAFEWTPYRIRWFVDGRLRHEETGRALPIPRAPQQLIVHLWNSHALTDWVGPIPTTDRGPWALQLSCVAYAPRHPGRRLCG